MEDRIIIEQGINIVEMRQLIEVTETMARAINREEFLQIMSVFGNATERLLKNVKE